MEKDKDPAGNELFHVNRHDDDDGEIIYEVMNFTGQRVKVDGAGAKKLANKVCDLLNASIHPTPASAMDGETKALFNMLLEYFETSTYWTLTHTEEKQQRWQFMDKIEGVKHAANKAALQPVMDQEIKRPKLGDWKKSRDTLQGSAYDQLVPETLQPVADFTDKYNSSDKPWCCWINQESGEECKTNLYGGFVCSERCDYRSSLELEQSMPGHGHRQKTIGQSAQEHYNRNWRMT